MLKTALGCARPSTSGAPPAATLNEAIAASVGGASTPAAPSWPTPRRRRAQSRTSGSTSPRSCARPAVATPHLVTQAWERLEDVFIGLGFQVAEGPEVETEWHNFEALNMPRAHPARSDFDTLFVDHAGAEPGRTVLRTHTSPVQIRAMLAGEPPIYIVAPGPRVPPRHARRDPHARVPPDRGAGRRPRTSRMADLAGTIEAFTKAFFGAGFTSRLRPELLPVHRAVGRVRHPHPDGRLARARRVRHGAPQRAARRRHRPRGVERVRLRLRHRPHGASERHEVGDLREMFADDLRFIEQF